MEPEPRWWRGNLPTHTGTSIWREMKAYGYHAYIISDQNGNHGMQIFDMRRLRDVVNPPVQFTEDGKLNADMPGLESSTWVKEIVKFEIK